LGIKNNGTQITGLSGFTQIKKDEGLGQRAEGRGRRAEGKKGFSLTQIRVVRKRYKK